MEMYKEFYQAMVDSNLSYNWKQEDEKVLLLYIVNYNLLQMMVVVDIGYYSKQVDYLAILQSVSGFDYGAWEWRREELIPRPGHSNNYVGLGCCVIFI